MNYKSNKKTYLFWALIVTLFIGFWLLWLGVDAYILTKDPLSHIESSKAILMAVLAFFLFVLLLSGLVLSTMIGNKRYSRYFSIYIGMLFLALLVIRSFIR